MRSLLVAVALVAGACAPTYAPPIRSPHPGAPGRAERGDVVLGGGATAVELDVPRYGGPSIAYGVRDWASIEAGADFAAQGWSMGWAGGRFTYAPRRHARYHLAADLETAAGLGLGGTLCGNDPEASCDRTDTRSWDDRRAGGGLLGAGVAGHLAFFAVYARGRAQLTKADNVPATLWGTAGLGIQFNIAKRVDLFSQFSFAGYTNRVERLYGMVYDVGLAVRIPAG